jgi:hypothetical protein
LRWRKKAAPRRSFSTKSTGGRWRSRQRDRRTLARLAHGGQLLAVTHSPQVAARGNTHFLIAKSSEGS